ncbi:HEAT repeat [Singulisphaera sp. GP187]|uniref:HEAT repeat domain-containing protein n=1 Tax=Singulisphaera sp. GP187 TaxID=1882752 RepID=UPI00092A9E66|nr:HEAT repeat domain-containing protein [Singulisphaera sp. GP187]SIN75293.1 HEAT repeat [Singulisphaera sp. GP187]
MRLPQFRKRTLLLVIALLSLTVLVLAILIQRATVREQQLRVMVSQIEHGDEIERIATIRGLFMELTRPVEFATAFPYLIQAMKDESPMVREAAASVVGGLILRIGKPKPVSDEREPTIVALCPKAEEALAVLLNESSPTLRSNAAKSLGYVAVLGKRDAPPAQLVACLDDEDDTVRIEATNALTEYGQGPESIVPIALRRLPNESPRVRQGFSSVFWHIRLQPSVLPLLITGLSSESTEICLVCTAAINHMGLDAAPALPAILALLRKEIDNPHPTDQVDPDSSSLRILGMAAGAIGEISRGTELLPESVELLREVLTRWNRTKGVPAPDHPAGSPADSPPPSPMELTRNESTQVNFTLSEAAWSLGILGRSAASAVPVLISTLEATPKESESLRDLIAEALVEIARGTRDEDCVIACLARAWKTMPRKQRIVLARALRNLGPKSGQVVPELNQLPADGTRSEIRRVRFPRSRRGQAVRE